MKIAHAQYEGIKLVGGFQFWSNPRLAETERAIPVVLSSPTLIDLVRLATKFGTIRLMQVNTELFRAGGLPEATFKRNVRRLSVIEKAQRKHA